MASSKQIHLLATNPSAMARFQRTGKLPAGIVPRSPLITLLERIGVRDLSLIVGVTVDHRLGYGGSRTFGSAAQALHWIKPSAEVFGSFPADSYCDKSFAKQLELTDLMACAQSVSESILRSHGRPASLSPRPAKRGP